MADIVLAQIGVRTWLVRGEEYLDDLLANTLRDDVTIEFLACESESEVTAMWHENFDDPSDAGMPWIIHPAIADRSLRALNRDGTYRITFAPWSAMRGQDSDAHIVDAAAEAGLNPDARIVLTAYVDAGGPALHADLANLRSGLLEAELAGKGVALSRIERARGVFDPADASLAERIDISFIAE
jgi:hypothetical protein